MEGFGNSGNIPAEFTWCDGIGLVTKELGKYGGSRKLYVNLDSVPSGGYSTKYHSHTQQEEFFYILSGNGTLKRNGEERLVKAGDFLAKPAGREIAHTFYNSGSEPLEILDIGTVEAEDTCHYPDEGVYMHKAGGKTQIFRENDLLESWSSEPNL